MTRAQYDLLRETSPHLQLSRFELLWPETKIALAGMTVERVIVLAAVAVMTAEEPNDWAGRGPQQQFAMLVYYDSQKVVPTEAAKT